MRHLLKTHRVTLDNHDPNCQLLMDKNSHRIIGSCNGLICLISSQVNFFFYLWNPATRSLSQTLGSFTDPVSPPNFKFSFGYDNLTHRFKVVAFRPNEVRVFSFGDNVWRNIQCFPTYPYFYSSICHKNCVYLSNSLVWVALRPNDFVDSSCYHWKDLILNVDQYVIVSLDLGTETNTQWLLPRGLDEVSPVMPIVSVLMDCLCFSYYTKGNDFVIWQMRQFGIEESWTKFLNFNHQNVHRVYSCAWHSQFYPLHVFENGDTLILARNQEQVIRYNKRHNRVYETRITNNIYWYLANQFVESLVSPC